MAFAGLLPIGLLGELVSIGTLLAFVIVCAGVLVLRYTDPNERAAVPHAARALRADRGDSGLRLPDAGPPGGHLGATDRLDGDRPGHLFPVRAPSFEGATGGGIGR